MGSIDKACISGFLCRLCSEMHRIVIHIYTYPYLVEKINGYLPITISPSDPLPKTICTPCLRRVEQHYDLLMRLSRIKTERERVNKQAPLQEVSSSDLSEEEVLCINSEDEQRTATGTQTTEPNSAILNAIRRVGRIANPASTGEPSAVAIQPRGASNSFQHNLNHSD